MGSLFNLDNPVWNFMGKVADLIILNMLAVICSIPIFTIGASWTALYFVTLRMVKKEESYVVRDFFRSFKENFKQATQIWLLVLLAIFVFVGDIIIWRTIPDKVPAWIMIGILILAIGILATIIYAFPILARFHNTTKNTLKNAFFLSIVNIPYTFTFVILILLPYVILAFAYDIAPVIIVIGFSGPAYIISVLLRHVFEKLEPKDETEDTEELSEPDFVENGAEQKDADALEAETAEEDTEGLRERTAEEDTEGLRERTAGEDTEASESDVTEDSIGEEI